MNLLSWADQALDRLEGGLERQLQAAQARKPAGNQSLGADPGQDHGRAAHEEQEDQEQHSKVHQFQVESAVNRPVAQSTRDVHP